MLKITCWSHRSTANSNAHLYCTLLYCSTNVRKVFTIIPYFYVVTIFDELDCCIDILFPGEGTGVFDYWDPLNAGDYFRVNVE